MDRSEGKNMKIPLVSLGLDCENKKIDVVGDYDDYQDSMLHSGYKKEGYNTRTEENEKSVLVIDEDRIGFEIYFYQCSLGIETAKEFWTASHYKSDLKYRAINIAKYLSQNTKSFLSIQKE